MGTKLGYHPQRSFEIYRNAVEPVAAHSDGLAGESSSHVGNVKSQLRCADSGYTTAPASVCQRHLCHLRVEELLQNISGQLQHGCKQGLPHNHMCC